MKHLAIATTIAAVLAMPATAQTMRLGHGQDPSDPVHEAATLFADTVRDQTGGDVDIRIFPASSLGDYQQMQDGLQQGSVDIVIESIGTLSRYTPIAGVESLPYLFDGADHYAAVWNGPVGQEIKEQIATDANFRVLGHMYRGARELTASRPVEKIEDLSGLKIRVSPMRERLVTWQVFGASPTPMSWAEVFTALQQGVIEAQENPLATIQSASLNEAQDYLILTSHMANGFTFQFNAQSFDALDPGVQDALRAAADKAADWYNAHIAAEEAAILQDLKDKGMTVIEIDRAPFREKAREVVAQFPDLEPWYARMTEAAAAN